jgi:hypothetical protein
MERKGYSGRRLKTPHICISWQMREEEKKRKLFDGTD